MRRLPGQGASRVAGAQPGEKEEGQEGMIASVWRGLKVASLRRFVGWNLVFVVLLLCMSVALAYAHLGLWLTGLSGAVSILFAITCGAASYFFYGLLVVTYFRWRVLGFTEILKERLRGDLVDKCPTPEASAYVALFSLFQFSRTNGLGWSDFDQVFFGLFPDAKVTVPQRKIMNELCGLAPAEGVW